MSKKKKVSEPKETETPKEIDYTEDGTGIDDPAEVMKRLAESEPEENTEEVVPGNEEDEAILEEEPEKEPEKEEEKSEEEPEEKSEEEPEEEEESEPEEPSQEEEPKEQEPSEMEKELETWKKRYTDSQREVQTKYLPMEKQLEDLTKEKEALAKERQEIADVLRSDPELLDSFVRAANNPELISKEPEKPSLDKDSLEAAMKDAFGADAVEALKEAKNTRTQTRMEAIDKFEVEHPGLTDEERVKLAQVAGSLETIEKIDLKSALDRAYIALYPDKAFEKKSKEIEEAAKIKAIKNRESVVTKTSGGSSPKPQTNLTAQEKVAARKLGMSEDDYIEYKTKA